MNNLVLSNYVRLFETLPIDARLTLLSALSESLRSTFRNKTSARKAELFQQLAGSWADVDDQTMITEIYASRTTSDRELNFDD